MTIGHRDLAIHRLAVTVVIRHGRVHRYPILQGQLAGVTHADQAIFGEAQRAGIEATSWSSRGEKK